MILTRSTRLSQPQSPAGLDISHPLAKYLTVWASPQFTQRGSATLSPLARIGDVPNNSGPSGVGWDFSATGENRVLLQSADRPSVAGKFYIVAARFKWNSTAAWGTIFGLYTGAAYVFTIARWTNGSLRLHTGGGDVFASGARYLENGKDYTVVMTVCGSSGLAGEAYINGQYVGKGAAANPASTTRAPCIGALDATTGYEYNDLIYGAAIFDHGPDRPSPELLRSLSANPWQLFRPVQRRIYFDMGAGGGGEPATHDTSGAITSSPAELSGAAERTRQHDTSAELAGAGSVVSATARRNVTLGSSGTLSVGLAVVTASASHTAGHAEHSTSGTVAAPGASLSGSASRVPAPVTHDTSGDLVGMGAFIDGQAQGPQSEPMRPGFEMSSRKVYIKRGKRIHIFDSVEDADAWIEAEQQALQAIRKAKPTKRKKAKVFKGLDEAVPHEVVRIDVVRAMVDYLGIPVEMPTLEARQDWAEVARVALMARKMQDEEDIELLLAA